MFDGGARGVVYVAAFGGDGAIMFAVVEQPGHAESGSGGDESAMRAALLMPFVKRVQLRLAQAFDAVGRRFQVVDQIDAFEFESLGERLAVNDPFEVRRPDLPVFHRPGDAETGVRHLRLMLGDKLRDD